METGGLRDLKGLETTVYCWVDASPVLEHHMESGIETGSLELNAVLSKVCG